MAVAKKTGNDYQRISEDQQFSRCSEEKWISTEQWGTLINIKPRNPRYNSLTAYILDEDGIHYFSNLTGTI